MAGIINSIKLMSHGTQHDVAVGLSQMTTQLRGIDANAGRLVRSIEGSPRWLASPDDVISALKLGSDLVKTNVDGLKSTRILARGWGAHLQSSVASSLTLQDKLVTMFSSSVIDAAEARNLIGQVRLQAIDGTRHLARLHGSPISFIKSDIPEIAVSKGGKKALAEAAEVTPPYLGLKAFPSDRAPNLALERFGEAKLATSPGLYETTPSVFRAADFPKGTAIPTGSSIGMMDTTVAAQPDVTAGKVVAGSFADEVAATRAARKLTTGMGPDRGILVTRVGSPDGPVHLQHVDHITQPWGFHHGYPKDGEVLAANALMQTDRDGVLAYVQDGVAHDFEYVRKPGLARVLSASPNNL